MNEVTLFLNNGDCPLSPLHGQFLNSKLCRDRSYLYSKKSNGSFSVVLEFPLKHLQEEERGRRTWEGERPPERSAGLEDSQASH